MADEPLSRVGKGDPITADWANAVADAINGRGASDPNANGTATPYGVMTPADVDTQMRAPDAQAMPFDAAIVRTGGDDEIWMAIPSGIDLVRLGSEAVPALPGQSRGDATNAWVKIANLENGVERFAFLALGNTSGSAGDIGWRVFVDSSQSPANWPAWVNASYPAILLASWNIAADDTSGADTTAGDVPSLRKGLVQHHRGVITFGGSSPTTPPMLLDVKLEYVTPPGGQPESHIFAYIGETSGQGYPRSLRVNGKPTEIDYDPAKLSAQGWLDLGQTFLNPQTEENPRAAVWIYAASVPVESGADTTYEGATNWGAANVAWRFDIDGTNIGPGPNAFPQNKPTDEWNRWLHPVLVALIRNEGTSIMQCVHGGMDFTFDVPDADGTHNGEETAQSSPSVPAGGFCSVEFGDSTGGGAPKQIQLYRFRRSLHLVPSNVSGGFNPETASVDIVAREHDGGESGTVHRARVNYIYLPALISYLTRTIGDDFEPWIRANAGLVANILRDYDAANDGPFWLSSGDHTTCYGSDIGNIGGTVVIDLDNLELPGAWKAVPGVNAVFQVDGKLDVTGAADVNGMLAVNNTVAATDLSAANNLTVGGNADITGNLSVGGSVTIGGDTYVPQTITVGGQQITVLAKQ